MRVDAGRTSWQPGRELVVRVAGMPAAVLTELRLPRTTALVTNLNGEGRRLVAEAAALSDELFELIGALGPAGPRAALVGLRRALAPGHRAPPTRLLDTCLPALPGRVADRVTAWVLARDTWDARRSELADVLVKERADVLDQLRAACADPVLRRGLLLASPELSDALDRWLADPERPPRASKVLRLAKYLARASAKTSPFGSFMVSALTDWSEVHSGPLGRTTVVESPGAFLDAVREALLADPELASRVPLRPNPSLSEVDGGTLFVRRGPGEQVVAGRRSPVVDVCLRHAEDGYTAPRLAGLLADAGADRAEAEQFVAKLVAAQMLLPCSPVTDDDHDPFGSYTDWLSGPQWEETRGALRELSAALAPQPPADLDAHRRRRSRVAAAMTGLAERLGIAPPAEPAHEVEVSALRPSAPPLSQDVLADLDAVRRWLSVFDWKVPVRVSVGAFCRERFGSGSRTPFLAVYRAVAEAFAAPHTPAAATLPHLFGPAAMPWFLDLAGNCQPRLRELGLLRERARALARGPGDQARSIPRAIVLDDMADWPDWLTSPTSVGFYLQTLPGSPAAVLNAVHAGHRRAIGRLHHLLGRAGAAPERSAELGLPLAEFGGRFDSALNTRTPSTRYEIDYPGAATGRDPEHRVRLGELDVVHEPATDLVQLHSARLNSRVDPVHLGMMGELALPAVAVFLERAFAPTYLFHPSVPPLISPRELAGTAAPQRFPRVCVGDVVLQRARWLVPADQAPTRADAGSDWGHLLALAEWCYTHGIPERCFVRGWKPDAELGKARKPIYVDFAAWHLVALFDREARSNAVLVIDEALPDPLAEDAPAHVTEYYVEVDVRGDADG